MSAVTPGLPLPNLDDRRWADLVEEGRTLIPLYAPEWTNHNPSDPGITLVELFAWLAEQGVFRIDRAGPEQVRKFLALAGEAPAPPQPARTVLALTPVGADHVDVRVDTPFRGTARDGALVEFRTLAGTAAVATNVKAFQVAAAGGHLDRTRRLEAGEPFPLWGDDPGPGSAFLIGLDRPLPPYVPFSLYWAVRDPVESAADSSRLRKEAGLAAPPQPAHHAVELAWEVYAGPGWWVPLRFHDETRSLTLNGRFLIWGSPLAAPERLGRVEASLYYLRCRIVSGRHDRAPQLLGLVANGVEAVQVSPPRPASLPAGPPPHPSGPGPFPRFENLRQGDGSPEQRRQLTGRPVVAWSVQVYTKEGGAWRKWRARPDFDASGRADADFVLDAEEGILTFGDGEHGRVLPPGAPLYVAYLATRAADGNGLFTPWGPGPDPHPPMVTVTQPLPARGGADTETLDQVEARLLDGLARASRAVTTGDCEDLAKQVPGTVVARAQAVADQHPDLTGVPAPGVISVTILPELPAARPAPTPGLCRTVACYLNRRGVIGTRIEVVGPVYRVVRVTATLQVAAGAQAPDVRTRALAALARFFQPLTGGPAGKGWPIGRDVYRAEVLQALADTPGVAYVATLELSLDGGQPGCGNLCLGPRGLPASGDHALTVLPASSRRPKAQAVP